MSELADIGTRPLTPAQIAERLRVYGAPPNVVAAPQPQRLPAAPLVFRFSSFGGFPVEPVAQSPHDPSAVYARFSLGA